MDAARAERGVGSFSLVIAASDWIVGGLDAWGRWDTLMHLPRVGLLKLALDPLVAPVLVFLGMFLLYRAQNKEQARALEAALSRPILHGVEQYRTPKRKSFRKYLLIIPAIPTLAALIIIGQLWFVRPQPLGGPQTPGVPAVAYQGTPVLHNFEQTQKPKATITQTTNAPCSGNALNGTVDLKNCGNVDPNKGTIYYKPTGTSITTQGSTITSDYPKGELPVWNEMVAAMDKHDWITLDRMSDAEIVKVPSWLTPYLFSAVAKFNLCQRAKGLERINYFLEKSDGNFDYSAPDQNDYNGQAKRIKAKIESGMGLPGCQ
jgi:hypothetical protein